MQSGATKKYCFGDLRYTRLRRIAKFVSEGQRSGDVSRNGEVICRPCGGIATFSRRATNILQSRANFINVRADKILSRGWTLAQKFPLRSFTTSDRNLRIREEGRRGEVRPEIGVMPTSLSYPLEILSYS